MVRRWKIFRLVGTNWGFVTQNTTVKHVEEMKWSSPLLSCVVSFCFELILSIFGFAVFVTSWIFIKKLSFEVYQKNIIHLDYSHLRQNKQQQKNSINFKANSKIPASIHNFRSSRRKQIQNMQKKKKKKKTGEQKQIGKGTILSEI